MTVGPITPLAGGLAVTSAAASARAVAITPTAPVTPGAADVAAEAALSNLPAIAKAAIGAAVAEAIPIQDGLATLLPDLSAALSLNALSPQVRTTIQTILAQQAPLGADITPGTLRTAITQSGLFLEATLASGLLSGAAGPDVSSDLKALLLQLSSELESTPSPAESNSAASEFAALQAAPAPPKPAPSLPRRTIDRPAPPVRGGPTAGQAPARSRLDPAMDPDEVQHTLGQDTESALARLQLSQIASIPEPGEGACWTFELPIAAPGGHAVAQFEIRRDGQSQSGAGAEPTWRARFSMDVGPSGPIHAEVTLNRGRTRVSLWAEHQQTSEALTQSQSDLAMALTDPDGVAAAVRVLTGAPAKPTLQAGRLVDQTS